ncbi:aminotransferase class I/II-fold pyridoxal phosphate-dependent enzyme [Candidatus Saccharibacteria bacterium]|nr:aminotransferase class I/II-fold pyridoxal phosphate-dependent enzyme [Candidatus Saccharibacteria bacterium]
MFFLGQSANYSPGDIFKHLFAIGNADDSKDLRRYLAVRYQSTPDKVALFHNGRSALAHALKLLLPTHAEVLVNGFTCFAVVEAVRSARLTPVFADINEATLHYDATELESKIKQHPNLKAIIIQNSLGITVDIAKIEKIAKQHQLIIIEDLAHCTGTKYKDGREVGTVGNATALSFGKGKSIDTISGGALIMHDVTVTQPLERTPLSDSLRDRWYPVLGAIMRGARHLHAHKIVTGVFLKLRLIERSADAVLDPKVRLTHWQARLALSKLKARPARRRPPLREPYLVDNRDRVLAKLADQGYIFQEIWYETPISPARYYKKVHFDEAECPNATKISAHIVNLPDYYSKEQLKPAVKIIKEHPYED